MSKGTGNVNGAASSERDDWKHPVNFSTSTNQTDVLHSCCNINLWPGYPSVESLTFLWATPYLADM